MDETIVLVDKAGKPTGAVAPKLDSHHSSTPLHLAFSCYVFNDKGELLVTRRSLSKKVWPGVWTNSVCGHPTPDEDIVDAIKRRLSYELGMEANDFQVVLPTYRYRTPPYNGIIENEFCPVYLARAVSEVNANPVEVEDYKWLGWDEFLEAAEADENNDYSWWCKDQLKQLNHNSLVNEYSKITQQVK